jgi:hypothetical protein
VKKYLLIGGTLLAFAAGSALAAPAPVSGFVGVNVGATFTDFDVNSPNYGVSSTAFVFGGQSAVNAWLSNDMSVQLDLQAESTTGIDWRKNGYCPTCSEDGRTGGIFGAHLSWRDPQSHLIGVFGGFSGQSNLDYDGNMSHVILGVEGQYYSGPITLYGQVGYKPLMSDSDEYEPKGLWFLRGVGRYFCDPNDKLQADLSYAGSDINGLNNGDVRYWNFGLSWEHRYDNSPFSTTVAYSGMWADSGIPGPDNSAQENVLSVGFKINFGDTSLQQADREGATLDMPNFGRAEAWSYWLGR